MLPAVRAEMGDWVYYVAVMQFSEIAKRVKRTDEIHSNERLRDWIQRQLQPRSADIAKYLQAQKQRFFNSIILGVYDGKPEWRPLKVPQQSLEAAVARGVGMLCLEGTEHLFAIDGQHRVEAIKKALCGSDSDGIKAHPALANEAQSVIFVAHNRDASGMERTRRLFSTMNRYAKPVSPGEIVALDEDNAFAIVTRELVDTCPILSDHRVRFGKSKNLSARSTAAHAAITSILGLNDVVEVLSVPFGKEGKNERRQLSVLRASQRKLEELTAQAQSFWELLYNNVPEIREAVDAEPNAGAAGKYRQKGGHLLFRPLGQRVFASATRIMMDRGISLSESVAELAKVRFYVTEPPWNHILWDGSKILTKYQNLAVNLLLLQVGAEPFDVTEEKVREQYRGALNYPTAELPKPSSK